MELSERAFSRDGYLICQNETAKLVFGAHSSRDNGCGWIAAYNLLRATLHPVTWQRVFQDLSRRLLLGGKRGLPLVTLMAYLREEGCSMRVATTLTGGRKLAERSRAGILLYGTGHSGHYVTFIREKGEQIRFLNAGMVRNDVTMTLREFYRKEVHFPLWIMVGIRG